MSSLVCSADVKHFVEVSVRQLLAQLWIPKNSDDEIHLLTPGVRAGSTASRGLPEGYGK